MTLSHLPFLSSFLCYGSYAMVLWALHNRIRPFTVESRQPRFSIQQSTLSGRRPDIPDRCPARFAELILNCWQTEAERRPRFIDIVQQLDKQLESCYDQLNTN